MAKKKISKKVAPKKTARKSAKPALPIDDTADLMADAANPRELGDEGAAGLRNSLKRFGDLSGIVWNRRTGELVCGHQRMSQIRAEYGDHAIEVLDAEAELGIIRVDEGHAFTVRVVDWSKGKQRTANVAANNQKTQGKFTDDLSTFLLEIEPDITAEMPGALDDLLILSLIDVDPPPDEAPEINHDLRYQIILECADEKDQSELLERFDKEKRKCKPLIS